MNSSFGCFKQIGTSLGVTFYCTLVSQKCLLGKWKAIFLFPWLIAKVKVWNLHDLGSLQRKGLNLLTFCSTTAALRRSWQGGMKTLASYAKHALPIEEVRTGPATQCELSWCFYFPLVLSWCLYLLLSNVVSMLSLSFVSKQCQTQSETFP